MTRLLLLLLMALLPLRGWAADRMALHMEAVPLAVQAQQSPVAFMAMEPECAAHMQAALTGHGSPADPAQHDSGHKACQSCQLCMAMAALAVPQPLALAAAPRMLPRLPAARFASADPARHAKPPIS